MSDRGRDRDRDRSQSRGSRPEGGETTSLLIRNLSYRVRADEIRRLMVRYGEVRDVYIPQDYYTKKPRGFAFVEFYNDRDAGDALHGLDRYEMDGRELSVVFAKDRRKTADEMRPVSRQRGDSRERGGGGGGRFDRGGRDSRERGGGGRYRSASRSRSRDRGGRSDRGGGGGGGGRGGRRADSPPPRRREASPKRERDRDADRGSDGRHDKDKDAAGSDQDERDDAPREADDREDDGDREDDRARGRSASN